MATDPAGTPTPDRPRPRWPKVIGTIGAALGVIMFVDKADDLLLVPMLGANAGRVLLFGPELGDLVARTMPPGIWLFFYILLGLFLGLLLIVGSLRLRRCRRSGVRLCRAWAWLSIAWLGVALAGGLWWLGKYGGEVSEIVGAGWQGTALSGSLMVLALLLAYPVFLLVWFARPSVREEYLSWGDGLVPTPSEEPSAR